MIIFKMASSELVLSEVLYFLTNKFGKSTAKTLKSTVLNFFDADEVSTAKNRLLQDVSAIVTDIKAPHIPGRRDGESRTTREIDDIFTLLTYIDENKFVDQLPKYVSANFDRRPATQLCEGDLKLLFTVVERLEEQLKSLGNQLSAISRDVHALQPISTHSVVWPRVSAGLIQPTTQPAATNNTVYAGGARPKTVPHTSVNGNSVSENQPCSQPAQLDWAKESESVAESTDDDIFSLPRHQRRKKRRLENRSNERAAVSAADGSNNNVRRTTANRPVIVVGKAKLAASSVLGVSVQAAKPIFPKKAVYYVDNVNVSVDADNMTSFVQNLGVSVVACNTVKPRRRRNEIDTSDRHAFHICIHAADKKKFLNPSVWPEYVCISDWRFKDKTTAADDTIAAQRSSSPAPAAAAAARPTDGDRIQASASSVRSSTAEPINETIHSDG